MREWSKPRLGKDGEAPGQRLTAAFLWLIWSLWCRLRDLGRCLRGPSLGVYATSIRRLRDLDGDGLDGQAFLIEADAFNVVMVMLHDPEVGYSNCCDCRRGGGS
jgi:hypothetical protein